MKISAIIPVLHESRRINHIIGHLMEVRNRHDGEIIIVDGDPLGSTLNAIAESNTVKLISGAGRGRQMNAGAAAASGDVLLFLHADTLLPENAFAKIESVMRDNVYAGGAFKIGIDSDRISFRFIEIGASLRSRITGIPYGDQAIFIRKSIFEALGGYKDFPIMEDVELMGNLKRCGYKIITLPERVSTSPRRWLDEGILYCTIRNWTLITLYSLGVSPHKLTRFYRSSCCKE